VLTKPLTLLEVQKAIRELSTGKVVGEDGIPIDFFKDCSEVVEVELFEVVQEVFCMKILSKGHNKGIIALIPKGGDTCLIKNYRPITLLSSFYKLVAKMLALRLQIILPEIVMPNQTRFV